MFYLKIQIQPLLLSSCFSFNLTTLLRYKPAYLWYLCQWVNFCEILLWSGYISVTLSLQFKIKEKPICKAKLLKGGFEEIKDRI